MRTLILASLFLFVPAVAAAQGWIEPIRPLPGDGVTRVRTEVSVRVEGRIALVEVDEWFENRGSGLGEGDYHYALPGEAVFTDFSLFQGDEELRGETMDASTARRIYEEIVRRRRDPALIELAGHGLIRARIFPIDPGETRRITLRYTQLLDRAGDALQFRYSAGTQSASGTEPPIRLTPPLPRSQDRTAIGSTRRQGTASSGSLTFALTIEEGDRFRDPFSPTHEVRVTRRDGRIQVRPVADVAGDFAVFLPLARGEVGMTLATHRPAGEDGYFMLTLSPGEARADVVLARDLTAVVDVSGSMSGGKLEQAKEALRQLLGTLAPLDRFRLVAFGSSVQTYEAGWSAAGPTEMEAALAWVDGLRASGGTNIAGALTEAFRLEPRGEALPIVVFLTDGLPSVGEQDPERLALMASRPGGRARLFAFGIGYDVNTYLLDRLSVAGRGRTEYVEPGESVEAAVGSLATRIAFPILTDLRIAREPVRLTDVLPGPLPDLFAGEDLVIFGRYVVGSREIAGPLRVEGVRNGRTESFTLDAEFPAREPGNIYISRLWAARKLGEIDRTIRLEGSTPALVEEARQLALRHGLISAYSAYLVQEPMEGSVRMSGTSNLDAAVGRAAPAPPPPAASGAAAVRAASEASRQRDVRSEAELRASADIAGGNPDIRMVAGRRFELRDGIWTDVAHRSDARIVRIEPFSPLYFELLDVLPELRSCWTVFEESLVAGASISLHVVEGSQSKMAAADRGAIVRMFRGS